MAPLIRRLSRLARLRSNPPALSAATPPGCRAGSLVIKYSPETQYCGAKRNREIDVFLGFIIKDIVSVSSCLRQKKQRDLSFLCEEFSPTDILTFFRFIERNKLR